MSTRCSITFVEDRFGEEVRHHVYQHGDGSPSGVAKVLERTLPLTWPLPRFEADSFAASYIAASIIWHAEEVGKSPHARAMQGQHGMRLQRDWKDAADIEYHYEIRQVGQDVVVAAWHVHCDMDDKWADQFLYRGKLKNFVRWADRLEKRRLALSQQ